MEIKPGVLVRSKAGRDKGHVYAAIDLDEKTCLCGGWCRKASPPYEKKRTPNIFSLY